ncbi:MAG: phosphoribosylanthranilate isomerase [Bacteroidota bacterium]
MKIKVCGLRQPANIEAISALEVNYLGFIFHEASPRYADNEALKTYLNENEEVLEGIGRVGVFVNAEIDYILNIVHDYRLNWVQLHGNESPGYCQELQLLWSVSTLHKAKICKAFRITPDFDFTTTNAYLNSCPLFVFDTGGKATFGGTGEQWDWELLNNYQGLTPFLLSGGIGPDDIARIRSINHPQFHGVDLNSGFEIEPGLKDVDKLANFVGTARKL